MPKFYTRLFKIQLALCFALIFSLNIFGQTDALKIDLTKSFKKFDLVRINPNQALQRQIMGRQSLTLPTAAKTFELNLIPNDLRSPRYRAEATSADGVRSLEKGEVTTYKGTVGDENNSVARLTIDDQKIEGFFDTNGERYFIEPANLHSALASKNDFVVFKKGDFLNDEGFSCASETEEKIEQGINYVFPNGFENRTGYKVIELATEADFQYVSATGGSAATNAEILGILNKVEGLYQNELGLTINVVYQHTWETQDPFDGSTLNNMLNSFRNYWNANFPSTQYPRDGAHLWTGKQNLMNQGRALISVTCNPAAAYGFSGRSEWQEAKVLITGHEIAHNLGANHAEAAQSCDNTIMNATLSTLTPLTFCAYSRTEISNYVAAGGGCLAPQASETRFDFDGDSKADIAVFRPESGAWYINKSTGGLSAFQFGANGDKPVSSDYDGDGKADAALYRNGAWYVLRSSDGSFFSVGFGIAEDIPTPADFDGDGKSDIALFRPSTSVWYRLNSTTGAFYAAQFGTNGDVPIAGDYDGDGKADINLFRPSNGVWYRLNSGDGAFYAAQFGAREDKAVSGDFDGDGKDDLALFRPSTGIWYVLRSSNGSFFAVGFGLSDDIPTAADFDGDGKTDIAVYRPLNGVWYRLNSGNGAYFTSQFGIRSDIPAQSYYIR